MAEGCRLFHERRSCVFAGVTVLAGGLGKGNGWQCVIEIVLLSFVQNGSMMDECMRDDEIPLAG